MTKRNSNTKTYLIKDTSTGLIKIGKAIDVNNRLQSLQCGSASKLNVVHVFDADIERVLHLEFKESRKHGEWFDIQPEIILAFADTLNLGEHQSKKKEIKNEDCNALIDAMFHSFKSKAIELDDYGFQCEWVPELMRYRDSGQPYFEIEYQKNPLIKREYEMICMIIFGKTEAMIRISLGVHDYDDLGPSLPKSVFDVVRSLQRANTVYIEDGLDFQERKAKLTDLFNRKHKHKIIDEIHLLNA